MQRKWRRAWLRGKPHYMRHKPVRKIRTGSIKSKVYSLTAKAAKKLVPAAAAAGIFLSSLTGVQANPTGGNIAAGTGSITGQGTNSVTINQTSDKLAINWNSFNIGSGEKVQFIQPGASSIALNRVLGNNASSIYGQLSANGKVFLINPNGVLFAKGAQVNVGGLVASTLNLSDKDFMSGKYTFSGDSQNGVLNQGNITAANGGYVALLGANAANEGVILAKEGTVALGAGSKVALDFTGDGLLTLSVDESKVKAEVKNSGLIKADGGLVVMNAKAADALTGSVVNNTGTIEAKSVTSKNGTIILTGDTMTNAGALDASGKGKGETGGTVKVLGDTVQLSSGSSIDVSGDTGGGTALVGGAYQGGNSEYAATKTVVEQGTSINADALTTGNGGQVVVWANDTTSFAGSISAKGGKNSGDGGSVETSGHKTLTVADTASVNTKAANGKTGNWLLDPVDITIGAGGDIEAGTLETALGSSNVTITTGNTTGTMTSSTSTYGHGGSGDITVNENVLWHNTNSLTLSAYRNININALIVNTSADGAAVTLRADNTGTGIGTVSFAADGSGTISTNGKVNIYYNPTSKVSATIGGNTVDVNSYNYKIDYSRFVYKADGATFSTPNAYMLINNVYDLQYIGTNSTTLGGIYALGANIDASVTKNWNGGAGFVPIGNDDTRFTGSFDGGGHTIAGLMINRPTTEYVGLFGYARYSNPIANISLVNASIKGQKWVGSLAGLSYGQIINASATGSVNGDMYVGGLVGQNNGSISNSYVTGSVNGDMHVGGLVGKNQNTGSISNSYTTGSVKGNMYVGGLVGSNSSNGGQIATIGNSYATGSITVSNSVAGGLVGSNNGNITSSYATGKVLDRNTTGGLVGSNYGSGSITSSYWDANTTGKDVGVGEDTSSGTSTYTALYSSTGGTGTAFTKGSYSWFDASGNSTDWYMVEGSTRPFLRSEYSTTITNAHQLQLMALDLTKNYTLANNIDMGELNNASGMWRTTATADSNNDYGFTPIGNSTTKFTGTFDGGGHTISSLTIKRSGTDYVGLFGDASGATLSNIGLVNTSVIGKNYVGGLAGYVGGSGSISSSYSTGSVTGEKCVGGLAGQVSGTGSVNSSYAKGTVTGNLSVGGLVGYFYSSGSTNSSYATGSVTGSGASNMFIGGLVGNLEGTGSINSSYATGSTTDSVKGYRAVGGLVGNVGDNGSINSSYATVAVSGSFTVGGLAGQNNGQINNSYATGSASSGAAAGGLVGQNFDTINNSYATGSVTGTSGFTGGLVGVGNNNSVSTISKSYWDTETTGQTDGVGKPYNNDTTGYTGLTSAQMKRAGNFSGWTDLKDTNGNNVWYFYDGLTAPLLRSFLTPLTITVSGASPTSEYNGTAYLAFGTPAYSVDNPVLSGKLSYGSIVNDSYTANTGNAGTYTLGGLYSNQQGYAITYVGATGLTITPKALSATQAAIVSKTYDKNDSAAFGNSSLTLNGVIVGDSVSVTGGTGTYDSVNAGDRTVTVTGVTLDNSNYSLAASAVTGSGAGILTGHIDKKVLSATQAATVTKTYDKNDSAAFGNSSLTLNGVIGGDSVGVTGTGTYDSVNAGNRTVTVTGVTLDNANYKLDASSVTGSGAGILTGYIDKKVLSATQAATVTKTYDKNDSAAFGNSSLTLNGVIGGDSVGVTGTGTYDSVNAGNRTVTVTDVTLDNTNYSLTASAVTGSGAGKLTGHIEQKALSATQAATVTKTYDKNDSAAFGNSSLTLNGVIGGDNVSITGGTGTYDSVNAGNRTVTVTGVTLDNSNYSLAASAVTGSGAGKLTGHIEQKALSATQAATVTKTYDKNDSAVLDAADITLDNSGVIGGDSVSVSGGTGTYDSVNAGNRTVTVTGVTLDNANYKLDASSVTGSGAGILTGHIDKKVLSATQAATVTKTYDKNDSAAFGNSSLTLNGVIGGDNVSITGGTGTYDSVNAGNRTVTVTGVTLDNSNYSLAASAVTGSGAGKLTGHIEQKALSATQAVTVTKTYDKSDSAVFDAANITLDTSGVIVGDSVSVTDGTGTYDSVNAGNRTVTVTGVTLDNANYKIDASSVTGSGAGKLTGTINKAALTITAITNTKTYDGTTTAKATPTYTGLQTGDTLTLSEIYDDKNVGTSKTLTANYVINDGNGGKNYNVTTQTATGSITQASLTVTANDATKINDNKTAYTGGNGVTYTGLATGETGSDLGGSLTYGGTSQGATAIGTYTITPGGLTSTNYMITFKDGTLTIKPAAITEPGYIAAVQNTQQNAGDNAAGTSENRANPPAANAASPQLPTGQVSPIQYRNDTTGTPRVITTAGQTVTIAQDSLLHLATNPVQREIAVYQTLNGSTALAGAYHVDSSQGSLALRESAASFAPVSPEMPASIPAQAETSSFQLTDSQGNTVNITIAYSGGNLYVQGASAAATDMLSQNRQLATAAALVAAQDKLSIDINNLQAVVLE